MSVTDRDAGPSGRSGLVRAALMMAGLVFTVAIASVVWAQFRGPLYRQTVHLDPVADFSKPSNVKKWATDIFVGKVIGPASYRSLHGDMGQTQYPVQVLEALKGDLRGVVLVNQEGGERWFGLVEDQTDMHSVLAPGRTYLFAGRRFRKHVDGRVAVTTIGAEGELMITSDAELQDIRKRLE